MERAQEQTRSRPVSGSATTIDERWAMTVTALAGARTPRPVSRPQARTAAPAPDAVVDDLVRALGAFLGYDLAVHVDHQSGPVHQWLRPHRPGDEPPSSPPGWLAGVGEEIAGQRDVITRVTPQGGGWVAVPVLGDDDPVGALVFYGASLRAPDEAAGPMLAAVARLLAGVTAVDEAASSTSPVRSGAAEGTSPPAMALVDVFAFTVRVVEGEVQWRYFGPNSEAVFGQTLTRSEGLPELLRRFTHAADIATAEVFVDAVLHGLRAEVELRLLGEDGATRWVSWRAVPRVEGDELFVDGVATDVSARHSLGRSRRELAEARRAYSQEVDVRREHARAVRDANDNVLQRLFATGLRLQTLQRRLDDTEAHAASAIAFQLDQAVSDLREVILNLNNVIESAAGPSPD